MSAKESEGNWRPVPDPTLLTTEALRREIQSLTEYMLREVAALKTLIESSQGALKELVDTKVNAHNGLDDTRFDRIDSRFATIERHRVEQKEDTDKRINYVISSLKEQGDEHFKTNQSLIIKSEQASDASIAKLGDGFKTTTEAILQRIDDLKERVGKIEAIKTGVAEERTEGRAHLNTTAAIIGTVVAVVVAALALLVGRNTGATEAPPTPPIVTVTVPTK